MFAVSLLYRGIPMNKHIWMTISLTLVLQNSAFAEVNFAQSLVKLTSVHSGSSSIEGSLIKDAALPNEVNVITVAHGKKLLCKTDEDLIAIEFSDLKKLNVRCADYITAEKSDVGFIFINKADIVNMSEFKKMANQLAAYNLGNPSKSICHLTGSNLAAVTTNYDGLFIQAVTNNIPGCSGSPLINKDGRIHGIFKGFALESNRSLYTPITLNAIQPLLARIKKLNEAIDIKNLNDQVPTTQLAGTRGDPLDGNPITSQETTKLAVPYNLLRKNDLPSFFLMKLPFQSNINNTTLQTEGLAYFGKDIPLLSCTYTPFDKNKTIKVGAGFTGVSDEVLNLDRFNSGTTYENLLLSYNKGDRLISEPQVNNSTLQFGFGRSDYLWSVSNENFGIKLKTGSIQITDADLGETITLKDPNICARLITIYSQKLKKYIHYNVYMHYFTGHEKLCPYIDVIIKRATSEIEKPNDLEFETYSYIEKMVTLPNTNGEQCKF